MGHFFFETVTVNADHYRAMLNEYSQKLKRKDIGNIWLKKNGATCHTAEATFDVLHIAKMHIALSAADLMSFGHFGAAI